MTALPAACAWGCVWASRLVDAGRSPCWRQGQARGRQDAPPTGAIQVCVVGRAVIWSPYVGCAGRTNDRTSGSRSGPACCAGTSSSRSYGACTPRTRASRQFEHRRPCLLYFKALILRGARRHIRRERTPPAEYTAGQKKTPGPRHEVSPRIATARTARPLLLRLTGEGGGPLIELVELEAAGEALGAPTVEKVVGLLVVED
jgi:hypothetical protein